MYFVLRCEGNEEKQGRLYSMICSIKVLACVSIHSVCFRSVSGPCVARRRRGRLESVSVARKVKINNCVAFEEFCVARRQYCVARNE